MRISDVIYFAPDLKVTDLDFENRKQIILAFQRRINEYYLNPARILDGQKQAFATGVLLVTTIDAITYYSIGSNDRIKDFVRQSSEVVNLKESRQREIAKNFDDFFRNGIVHEGRVKNCGQFSYDFNWLFQFENDFMVVNPNILLTEIDGYFRMYLRKLESDDGHYTLFINKLKRQFEAEVHRIKALYHQQKQ